MEDRIKIGDVWYVKEITTKPKEEFEILMSREIMIETTYVLVEGSVLEDENELYSFPSISITYKTVNKDKEFWDNEIFLSGVANREKKHMDELEDVDEKTKEVAIALIDKMAELEWI